MMSVAMLMTAGAEQTKVPAAPDQLSFHEEGLEAISFAKSFGERIGTSTSTEGKSTADDAAVVLPGMKNATFGKKPDEAADISGGGKGTDIAAQKIIAHGGLKNSVAGKIIQVKAEEVAEPQDKATTSDSEMKTVESPAPVEASVDEPLPGPPAPDGALIVGATNENPGLHPAITEEGQPFIANGGRPVIQKETEAGEKVKETVSAKRTAKAEESAATPKTVEKTTETRMSAIGVDAKPAGERLETAVPVVGQEVVSTVPSQVGMTKRPEDFSKAVSAMTKPSTGVSSIATAGQVRKESASGTKASVADTEVAVTAGSDPVASPKTSMSPEKPVTVASLVGRDGEIKPQAASEPGAALLHPAGTVSAAVVSGNAPEELTAIKPLVGDAGAHAIGLPAASREQDGPVAVAQSMDGAPRMLAATATSLEVGVQNGTHGWLKVRAEMTEGGVVNASVSAASSAGQEMLHRELPALTAYLQEEKVAVNAVIVHAPSIGGSDPRSSAGMSGAGGQAPQGSNERGEQDQNLRKTPLAGSDEPRTYLSSLGSDEDGSSLAAYASGGGWLSVRA